MGAAPRQVGRSLVLLLVLVHLAACGAASHSRDEAEEDAGAVEEGGWTVGLEGGDLALVLDVHEAPGGGLLLAGNGALEESLWYEDVYPTALWAAAMDRAGGVAWALLAGMWVARANDAAPTAEGGLVMTGLVADRPGDPADLLAVALGESGELLWQVAVGGPDTEEEGLAILARPDGGALVLARRGSIGRSELWLLELTADGGLVGNETVLRTGYPVALVALDDGLVAVGRTTDADPILVRMGPEGSQMWRREFSLSRPGHLTRFVASPEGGLVGAGAVSGSEERDGSSDLLLAGFDRSGGLLWERLLDLGPRDDVRDLVATPAGAVAIGSTDGPGDRRVLVVRLGWDGALLSAETLAEEWTATAFTATAGGDLIVVGEAHQYGHASHVVSDLGSACHEAVAVAPDVAGGIVSEREPVPQEPRPVETALREIALEVLPWQSPEELLCGGE